MKINLMKIFMMSVFAPGVMWGMQDNSGAAASGAGQQNSQHDGNATSAAATTMSAMTTSSASQQQQQVIGNNASALVVSAVPAIATFSSSTSAGSKIMDNAEQTKNFENMLSLLKQYQCIHAYELAGGILYKISQMENISDNNLSEVIRICNVDDQLKQDYVVRRFNEQLSSRSKTSQVHNINSINEIKRLAAELDDEESPFQSRNRIEKNEEESREKQQVKKKAMQEKEKARGATRQEKQEMRQQKN